MKEKDLEEEEDMLVILEAASGEDAKAGVAVDTDVKEDIENVLNTENQEKESIKRKKNSVVNKDPGNIETSGAREDSAAREDLAGQGRTAGAVLEDQEDISFLQLQVLPLIDS